MQIANCRMKNERIKLMAGDGSYASSSASNLQFEICNLQSRRGGRVVYCGGLENRFGFTADGGSNPSLSANLKSYSHSYF